MPSVAISLTPVDRARRRIELPVITADDSPGRNPAKVKTTPTGRHYRNEPYGHKAVNGGNNAGAAAAGPAGNRATGPIPRQPGGPVKITMPALAQSEQMHQQQGAGATSQQQQPISVQVGVGPSPTLLSRPKPKVRMAGLEAPEGSTTSSGDAGSGGSVLTPTVPPPTGLGGDGTLPPVVSSTSSSSGGATGPVGLSTPSSSTGGVGEASPNPDFTREQTGDSVITTTSTVPSPPKGLGSESPARGAQTPGTPAMQGQPHLTATPVAGADPSPSDAFASPGRPSTYESAKPAIAMTNDKPKTQGRGAVVVVKFKHQDGVFMLPDTDEQYAEGDFVVVEGDRGEHVGRIDQLHIHHRHSTAQVGNVMRKAYPPEVELVHRLRMQEPSVTKQVQNLAVEMDVLMEVIDTELQTDRNKVTVYYRSKVDGPVDFRQLQRRLFREFRCRIWFVDWETM